MITFVDGPAQGVKLVLQRAPLFLRVVRKFYAIGDAAWDALDQLEDQARAGETLFVYMLQGPPTRYHVCTRGKNQAESGWRMNADYSLYPRQPDQATLRDNALWRKWVRETPEVQAAKAARVSGATQ